MPPLPMAMKGAFAASMPKFPPIPSQVVKTNVADLNSGKVHGLKNATSMSMQVCEKNSEPGPSNQGSFAQVNVGEHEPKAEAKFGEPNTTLVVSSSTTTT
jgi:hypothetical protein